jgi:hypothetical protein
MPFTTELVSEMERIAPKNVQELLRKEHILFWARLDIGEY